MKKSIGVLVTFLLVFLVFSPTHAGMNDGLVAYWPFNGNANDESGNGNDGIVSNATLTTDRLGNSNQAYSFNGSNSYVDLPSLYAYSPTYLTLHAWVKYDSDATGRKIIIAKLTGLDTPGNLGLEIRGNVIAMNLNKDGSSVWHEALGSTPLAGDRWYHVAATYDGSHIKVFLNGVPDGSTPYSQGIPINTIPWMIGVHPRSGGGFFSGFSFKGTIDDVGIYGRALSDAEIRELYEGTAPPSGLVSWWPGEGNADDIVNGNDGMLQGGVTFAPGKVGQAFRFDQASISSGVDDFVKIPASANLDVGLGSGFTLDAWINPADASTYRPLFEWNNGSGQFGPGAVFWIVPGAALAATLVDTAGAHHAVFTSGGIVQAGVWQHVALTYEKQTGIAKIYLNGNPVATLAVGTFTPQTSYDLYLGHRPPIAVPHEHRYVGLMDEAEVFNRALAASEIQAIFNAGSAGKCKEPADTTPPVITANVDGTLGNNGWYRSDVTVSWTVEDPESAITLTSGCDPSTISTDTSEFNLTCSATSAGGTASESVTGKRDAMPPTVTYSGNAGTYTIDQTVSITCTAADALSGVASNTCANINGPAYTFALGTNTFSASATDLAGNTGSGSTSFTVEVTAAGLGNLVTQFVTKAGVANSMISKLNAAAAAEARGNTQAKAGAIGAFINEVQAQSGKALTADQAAILIRLAQAF